MLVGPFADLLHRQFVRRGTTYTFMGMAPNGRCMFTDGAHGMLEVADPETGLPVWPTSEQARNMMATMDLVLRSCPLRDATRRRARRQELTRDELVNAKTRSTKSEEAPKRRDPWFGLREQTLQKVDEVGCPPLSKKGIVRFFNDHFDVEALKLQYGRLPSDFAVRRWVRKRGTPEDRRPADFASYTGLGPRARKMHPMVLAIVKVWALRFHSKPFQFKNSYYEKAKADVQRYAAGKALELHDFQEIELDPPTGVIKMCARRIFNMEVERAKGKQAFGVAYGRAAVRQRFGGGGRAPEPTRYLEIVQIDDTPFPVVFVVDPVRGVPCGVPTVTIAVCIYTRVIVGWDVSFDPPSHVTLMSTLLHTALPKVVPAPFAKIHELGDLYGKIACIVVDHAKHQISRSAQDVGGDIGSALLVAGKKQPTHKGHVESLLGTLQGMVREKLKGATYSIPLMREFDYDPAKHAVVTIQEFREIFEAVIADYHTSSHTELNERTPLDVWLEQKALHDHDVVGDVDVFERAICNLATPSFRGQGAEINGLVYGSDGSDDEFPMSNEDILFNLAQARGIASDTKKRTFAKVKIKWDPRDLGHAWLFDELLQEYVRIPCTRRRYATGLPFWLHQRIKLWAKEKKKKFDTDFEMVAVREEYVKWFSRILPKATKADRVATARLHDSSEGRKYLGDAVLKLKIQSSISGMETNVAHNTRVGERRDANRISPRSSSEGTRKERDPVDHTSNDVRQEQAAISKSQSTRTGWHGWDE